MEFPCTPQTPDPSHPPVHALLPEHCLSSQEMGDSAVSLPPCARDSLCSTCCHQRSPHADGRRSHSKVPSYTCVLGPALYQPSWVEFPGRLTLRQVWGREKLKRLPRSTPREGGREEARAYGRHRLSPGQSRAASPNFPASSSSELSQVGTAFTGYGLSQELGWLWLVSGCPPKPHKEETDS